MSMPQPVHKARVCAQMSELATPRNCTGCGREIGYPTCIFGGHSFLLGRGGLFDARVSVFYS